MLNQPGGARTRACRIDTLVDAWQVTRKLHCVEMSLEAARTRAYATGTSPYAF